MLNKQKREIVKLGKYYSQIRKLRLENTNLLKFVKFPKVSYYFIYYKLLSKLGKERIVDQMRHVKRLSDDVILVDYSSDDGIAQICKEVGVRYCKVNKTKGIDFHISKCFNRGMFEAKHNYVVPVNFDCIYPINMSVFISTFFSKANPRRIILFFRMLDIDNENKISTRGGTVTVYHKPSIMKIRGWDERLGKGLRNLVDRYIITAMEYVLNMKPHIHKTYYVFHKKHTERPTTATPVEFDVKKLLCNMKEDLTNRKFVVNSYW